jgi:WD40 repeat protein
MMLNKESATGAPVPTSKAYKLAHVSHRYAVHDSDCEVFAGKFSYDSSYMSTSFSDGSIMIYSSMSGDPLFQLKDDELKYPISGISWKPTPLHTCEA